MEVLVNNYNNLVKVVRCGTVRDHSHQLISSVAGKYAMDQTFNGETNADAHFNDGSYLGPYEFMPLPYRYVGPDDGMVFTDAGYIYLDTSVVELQSCMAKMNVFLQLELPHAKKAIDLEINPRIVGYGLPNGPIFGMPGDPISHARFQILVAMPNPVDPACFEPVEIIEGKYLYQMAYNHVPKDPDV